MRGAVRQWEHEHAVQGIIPAHAGSRTAGRSCSAARRDHPRACGEQLPPVRARARLGGIIPAHAGSSSRVPWIPGETRDHPRACGEQYFCLRVCDIDTGSSPRMRGAEPIDLRAVGEVGIIPAHAGSSARCTHWGRACRDHPRACGEQRLRLPVHGHGQGIIPAHAGSRRRGQTRQQRVWDHPRACGEQPWDCRCLLPLSGSSPRMRGAAFTSLGLGGEDGIIPAHAGSSRPPTQRAVASRDHPRACGEQARPGACHQDARGSSPRMRGAVPAAREDGTYVGIIPAHAGSSVSQRSRPARPWDHPRACGEQLTFIADLIGTAGSSPRMRGAALQYRAHRHRTGIIPAHAGSRLKNPSSKHPIPLMWAPF